MIFHYMNVETIGKCKKKNTNPANGFLLHTVEAIGKVKKKLYFS